MSAASTDSGQSRPAPAGERSVAIAAGPGVGYIDIDHVVLPVPELAAALSQLTEWGMTPAPAQRRLGDPNGDVGVAFDDVRHFVFAPAGERTDVANMFVVVDAAPGKPAPPAPVLVCAADDLEGVRGALNQRGVDTGEVEVIEPRVWIDQTSGASFAVTPRRLGMRGDPPFPVNGSQAGDLSGYRHSPWQAHPGGWRRVAGVTIAADDPVATATWLSQVVFDRPLQTAGPGILVLWPRDSFLRVVESATAGGGAAGIVGMTLLVDDLERLERQAERRPPAWAAGPVLHSAALPVDLEIVDATTLQSMQGWWGRT